MSGAYDPVSPLLGPQSEVDAILVALAHPYRRLLLEYLADADGPATITELAAAVGPDTDADSFVAGHITGIDSVETALYHIHVPKLADVDLVDSDRAARTVELTDRWAAVRPLLRAVEDL